jgi:hypothetical protein
MPISWTLHANKRLVYVTVTRPYTRDQGRAVVRALTAHPEFAGGFGFVIELIGGSDSAFTRDVQYFLTTHKETFSNSRIAIVITLGSRGAGDAALPEMPAEGPELPMEVQVLRTYREAERWLSHVD